ncbi:pyridoxal-phosphate dependent enzyme [Jhaorihella thermophila]
MTRWPRRRAFCADKGAHFLAPFDDDDVIEGQATVAVEVEAEFGRAPDRLVLPVGGGGLAAGVHSYFSPRTVDTRGTGWRRQPGGRVAGRPSGDVEKKVDNFVDGAAVARVGERTFARLRDVPAQSVLSIPEDRLCTTMIEMLNVEGIVLEPAGALSIDALADIEGQIRGKTVVCVTSGGNFDFERLPEVKERAQRYSGVKKYLILRLPQRPGALREFLNVLGPDDDIARFEYMKKSARNFGSVLIGIETSQPQNFARLFERLDAAGFVYTDITNDELLAQFVI